MHIGVICGLMALEVPQALTPAAPSTPHATIMELVFGLPINLIIQDGFAIEVAQGGREDARTQHLADRLGGLARLVAQVAAQCYGQAADVVTGLQQN